MTEFEMELSWLIYNATRDTWMDDAEYAQWKRLAWGNAKLMALEHPERFAGMPEALAKAMNTEAAKARAEEIWPGMKAYEGTSQP